MIQGISHITLIVKDLQKTTKLLQDVFDAKVVYVSGDQTFSLSKEVFFLIHGLWFCIMEGESLKERTYNHIALQISDEDFEIYKAKVMTAGAALIPDRPRIQGEGRSLYFYDFDNHLFELHTGSLEERLKNYLS